MTLETTGAFAFSATRQVTPLLRYATVLTGDPHLAQDIVQESLLRAQQRWTRIATLDAPVAYLKRMVTNEYLSWRRRRAAKDVALCMTTLESVTPPVGDRPVVRPRAGSSQVPRSLQPAASAPA